MKGEIQKQLFDCNNVRFIFFRNIACVRIISNLSEKKNGLILIIGEINEKNTINNSVAHFNILAING